jgi:hypothetical protein
MYVAFTDAKGRAERHGGSVEGERTRFTLELEADSEPIAGQIEESGGTAHEFRGYMSLIEAVERLRRLPGAPRGESPSREGASYGP